MASVQTIAVALVGLVCLTSSCSGTSTGKDAPSPLTSALLPSAAVASDLEPFDPGPDPILCDGTAVVGTGATGRESIGYKPTNGAGFGLSHFVYSFDSTDEAVQAVRGARLRIERCTSSGAAAEAKALGFRMDPFRVPRGSGDEALGTRITYIGVAGVQSGTTNHVAIVRRATRVALISVIAVPGTKRVPAVTRGYSRIAADLLGR